MGCIDGVLVCLPKLDLKDADCSLYLNELSRVKRRLMLLRYRRQMSALRLGRTFQLCERELLTLQSW